MNPFLLQICRRRSLLEMLEVVEYCLRFLQQALRAFLPKRIHGDALLTIERLSREFYCDPAAN